jgi:hypothetical protein
MLFIKFNVANKRNLLFSSNIFKFSQNTKEQTNSENIKPKKDIMSIRSIYTHIKPYFLTKPSKKYLAYSLVLTLLSKSLVSLVYNTI